MGRTSVRRREQEERKRRRRARVVQKQSYLKAEVRLKSGNSRVAVTGLSVLSSFATKYIACLA
jgi:hypothetical protein